mmetsp:Transcript_26075/g.48978  ORF Transcript_26075/g.48978 Transcript_26075/m.48978 type:complete len:183 (-) Transcript_26075:224-772(-)
MADQKIKSNIEDQLARLLTQLQDLEDMREDLDDDEYEEGKADTLKQMEEFEQSLSKMMTGDMTLVSELGAAQLAIQAAIRQANPSDTKQLFSNKEASALRRRLATLDEDHKLGKISSQDHRTQAVDVLKSLEKMGEVLSVGEKDMMESVSRGGTAFSTANESIDSSVMKTAATATTNTFSGR